MYIVYIKFQFAKRKGKEDKLPDILSNKEGPFVHLVKGNDCSRFSSVARSRVAKHVYENHIEQKNIYFKQNTLKLIYPVRYS